MLWFWMYKTDFDGRPRLKKGNLDRCKGKQETCWADSASCQRLGWAFLRRALRREDTVERSCRSCTRSMCCDRCCTSWLEVSAGEGRRDRWSPRHLTLSWSPSRVCSSGNEKSKVVSKRSSIPPPRSHKSQRGKWTYVRSLFNPCCVTESRVYRN